MKILRKNKNPFLKEVFRSKIVNTLSVTQISGGSAFIKLLYLARKSSVTANIVQLHHTKLCESSKNGVFLSLPVPGLTKSENPIFQVATQNHEFAI